MDTEIKSRDLIREEVLDTLAAVWDDVCDAVGDTVIEHENLLNKDKEEIVRFKHLKSDDSLEIPICGLPYFLVVSYEGGILLTHCIHYGDLYEFVKRWIFRERVYPYIPDIIESIEKTFKKQSTYTQLSSQYTGIVEFPGMRLVLERARLTLFIPALMEHSKYFGFEAGTMEAKDIVNLIVQEILNT